MVEKALYELEVQANNFNIKLLVYEDRYDVQPLLNNFGIGNIFMMNSQISRSVYYADMVSARLKKPDSTPGYIEVAGKIKRVRYAFDPNQTDLAEKAFAVMDAGINKSGASTGHSGVSSGHIECPYCGSKMTAADLSCRKCGAPAP